MTETAIYPPLVIARFSYRQVLVDVILLEGKTRRFAVDCPICGKACRLDGGGHEIVLNLSSRSVTVKPSIVCPNPKCGWHVRIRQGIALDVEEPKASSSSRESKYPGARGARLPGSEVRKSWGKR